MINYYKCVEEGYIIAIGTNGPDTVTAISSDEYQRILEIFHNKPEPPTGYDYILRDSDLQWELIELPPEPVDDPDAQPEDYVQVLSDLGVRLS